MLTPMHLNLTADEVLTTTRSVRKRLDFDRPVERALVEECLDIALQAPTGSNSQGWAWFVIEDPAKKQAVCDYYRTNFERYAASARPDYGTDDPRTQQREAVTDSARYLSNNFHRAPYLVIPLIQGRCEQWTVSTAQASTWGSILPAVWSFMLALRERGLGSAWTTLHLPNEREVADLLGIPYDRYTQAGLFPVAYTMGTDFKPAKRLPLSRFLHWDTF